MSVPATPDLDNNQVETTDTTKLLCSGSEIDPNIMRRSFIRCIIKMLFPNAFLLTPNDLANIKHLLLNHDHVK